MWTVWWLMIFNNAVVCQRKLSALALTYPCSRRAVSYGCRHIDSCLASSDRRASGKRYTRSSTVQRLNVSSGVLSELMFLVTEGLTLMNQIHRWPRRLFYSWFCTACQTHTWINTKYMSVKDPGWIFNYNLQTFCVIVVQRWVYSCSVKYVCGWGMGGNTVQSSYFYFIIL